MLTRRHLLAASAASPLVFALPRAALATSYRVVISGFDYYPPELRVAVGDRVIFTNRDFFHHTATFDDGSWDSGELNSGDSGELIMRQKGSFPYHCTYHGSMHGTIIVG